MGTPLGEVKINVRKMRSRFAVALFVYVGILVAIGVAVFVAWQSQDDPSGPTDEKAVHACHQRIEGELGGAGLAVDRDGPPQVTHDGYLYTVVGDTARLEDEVRRTYTCTATWLGDDRWNVPTVPLS